MIVFLSGASAGFGAAIARRLVQDGHRVIAAARREERLLKLREELGEALQPLILDVRDVDSLPAKLASLPPDWRDVEVLINNAGLALGMERAQESAWQDWQTMLDTNIKGLLALTHLLLPPMVAAGRGYIINMGSIAGSYPYPGGNVYGASKAFVQQFSLNLRADLSGSGVRVSNIEPGLAGGSEFSQVRFKGDAVRAEALYAGANALQPEDIAEAVSWLLRLPPHVNVNRLEMMPTSQSFAALAVHRQD